MVVESELTSTKVKRLVSPASTAAIWERFRGQWPGLTLAAKLGVERMAEVSMERPRGGRST